MKRLIKALGLGALVLCNVTEAQAQKYPDRPIKIIVPFAAGGAVDSLARIIGAKLQESMKQPVVVENRPGAGGNLAANAVAKAEADGYTALLTTNGHAISPALYKKLPFDAKTDFSPVSQIVSASLVLAVTPKFQAQNLQELLALARAKPGVLNYGSTGIGNPLHLSMEMLKTAAKVEIQMVPFRGDAPLAQSLVQGDVEMAILPLSTARVQVEAGAIRAIAVTSAHRSPAMPQVPTIAEQGVPGFASGSWQGLLFPAKTPPSIVSLVQKEIAMALTDPDVLQRLSAFGVEPVGSTPEAFAATISADIERFAAIVKEANIPKQE